MKKKTLQTKKIRLDETLALQLKAEAEEALQIAIIAEEEHRWKDAIEAYQLVVEKNTEIGDFERASAFQSHIEKLKQQVTH